MGEGLCLSCSLHGCGEEPLASVPGRWMEAGWPRLAGSAPGRLCTRGECSMREGVQMGLGWDQGMQNFTVTQTLWTSAHWGIKDYILKWLSFEGSKYGQRGPRKCRAPDSLLSLSWELKPGSAALPAAQTGSGKGCPVHSQGKRKSLATWLCADGLRLLA